MDEAQETCVVTTEGDWDQVQRAARVAVRRIAAVAYILLRHGHGEAVPAQLRDFFWDYAPGVIRQGSLRGLARMKRTSLRTRRTRAVIGMMEAADLEALWNASQ